MRGADQGDEAVRSARCRRLEEVARVLGEKGGKEVVQQKRADEETLAVWEAQAAELAGRIEARGEGVFAEEQLGELLMMHSQHAARKSRAAKAEQQQQQQQQQQVGEGQTIK